MQFSSIRRFVVGTALAGAIGLGGGAVALAQDVTPAEGHPSHIHVGTCAELDPNPVAPLDNLLPIGVDPDSDDAIETEGVITVGPVTYSESDDIEFDWETMVGSPHAIAVHESEANIQNYIACGDIGGTVWDDDGKEMVIGLHPVGDSGYSGIAILSEDDDGEVDVEVYLSGAPVVDDPAVEATPEG